MPSIQDLALRVLKSAAPADKVAAAHEAARAWRDGEAETELTPTAIPAAPDRPARPDAPELVPPREVPRRRLSSPAGRIALLHAVAHIEFNAIDLAFDLVLRFAHDSRLGDQDRRSFVGDWIGVGDDEARHFVLVSDRLAAMDAGYGDLPAHDGLWDAARATSHDLAARLAVAPMVLEARGLDVTPAMIQRLISAGDRESAAALEIIYTEEVGHVAAGCRWFHALCEQESRNPADYFQALVKTHFKGNLKPPFNIEARNRADLPADFYRPLA